MTWPVDRITPRVRVISDNDYSGDPDGLVQLAHHLLSPSVDLRLVVGSQVASSDPSYRPGASAEESARRARHIAELTRRPEVRVVAGANDALLGRAERRASVAAEAIVAEAMRDDTDLPLFMACGGGLTNIASAWLAEPRVASRLTLVWIGGAKHEDLADRQPGAGMEYNTSIDLIAAQVVFDDSDLAVWQVPRDAYQQVLASRSELLVRMYPHGELGAFLFDALGATVGEMEGFGLHMGETYVLGDSPLVLLTALLSSFSAAPTSCRSVVRPRARLLDSGDYESDDDGPPLRIFTGLDTRLVLEDLYAKLESHAAARNA